MSLYYRATLLAVAWILVCGSDVSAQMFGTRSLGTPISQRWQAGLAGSGAAATPGAATNASLTAGLESARFVRKNRLADSFVGADTRDVSHFVGAPVGGRIVVPAAVTDAQARNAMASANRQLQAALATPPTKSPMYPPRLQVSFSYSARTAEQLPSLLSQRLQACPELHAIGPIEVSLAGRTAIVRGTVASEWDRFVAQQLILFEPGISAVQNELKIQPLASNSHSPTPPLPEVEPAIPQP